MGNIGKYYILAILGFFGLGTIGLKFLAPYISPFLVGFVLAAVIDPFVDQMEKLGFRRSLIALLSVIFVFGGLVVILIIAILSLWEEVEQLSYFCQRMLEVPSSFQQFPYPLPGLLESLHQQLIKCVEWLSAELLHYVFTIPNSFLAVIVAAFSTYFISCDKRKFGKILYSTLPQKWGCIIYRLKNQTLRGLFGYLRAQIILMSFSAIVSIGSFLILDVPYAWVLGVGAGLLDLLPIVGPSGVYVPLIAYYLLSENILIAIILGIIWGSLLLIRQLWEPQIVGSQIGLHPLSSVLLFI